MDLAERHTEMPVTVLVSRVVKPGREPAFTAWAEGISREAVRFPGHRGVNVIRTGAADGRQFVLLFSFARPEDLQAWERSETRRHWLQRVDDLVEGQAHVQALTGLETWFSLPGEPRARPPARYKMAVVTELAIFPLLALLSVSVTPLLATTPLLLRLLVTSAVLVLAMTYLVMPAMARLFRRWLYT